MIGAIAQHYVDSVALTLPTFQSNSTGIGGVTNPATLNYPAVKTAGHVVIGCLGLKPETITPTDLASPWTSWVTKTGGTGANAADTGPTRACACWKTLSGSEGASESVTLSAAGNPYITNMVRYSGVDTSAIASTTGADNATGTGAGAYSATMDSDPGIAAGDKVVVVISHPTDAGSMSNPVLTVPGCTVAAGTYRVTGSTANGLDGYLVVIDFDVTAGSSTGAATLTETIASSVNLSTGPVVLVRLRGL